MKTCSKCHQEIKVTKKVVTLNNEEKRYVIQDGKYTSCLGFEVCQKWATTLAKELDIPIKSKLGTLKLYREYQTLVNKAERLNKATGWRSKSQLTPELIGLEGKRVEVVSEWGEKSRFYVGKSTGFIPCHLEISRSNSSGGCAVCIGKPQSVKVIR